MIKRRFGLYLLATLLVGVCTTGCGSAAVVDTALHGDLDSLKSEIEAAQSRGELDEETTRELAAAVAARLIVSAYDPGGASLLASAGACRHALIDAYRIRAERTDDTAAAAVQVLFEEGLLDAGTLVAAYRDSESTAWLAVAARAAIGPELSRWRIQMMRHPDERVRRAILEASLDARSPADLPELLVASRVDPDPMSRELALKALGAIGTPRTVAALNDRWRSGKDEDRLAIVQTWSQSPIFERGGKEQLEKVALGQGRPSTEATLVLLKKRPEETRWAKGLLARMIESRAEEEQIAAIAGADPRHQRTLRALKTASKDGSDLVQVEALGALLSRPEQASKARESLLEHAKGRGKPALQARLLLAKAGERAVIPLLEGALSESPRAARVNAALALTRLGMPQKAASSLAEKSRHARFEVACEMMGR